MTDRQPKSGWRALVAGARKSLCVVLPCLFGLLAAPASAEPIADWLDRVTQCSSAKPLRLGVIGFESVDSLPPAGAERVRLAIEAKLGEHSEVVTTAVRDAELLRDIQEEVLARVPPATIEQQLREAFLKADALVFFKGAARTGDGDRVSFHLRAVLPGKLDCAPVSGVIEQQLPTSPALQSLDSTLAKAVEQMMAVPNPAVTDVTVCPVENAGEELSPCASVLTGLVVRHLLDNARRSRSAALTNRTLLVKRALPGRCTPAGTAAYGSIRADGDKRLWMTLEFRRGNAVLAAADPTQVFPQELGCDARLQPFFEYVRNEAHVAAAKLSLRTAKPVFARGDLLGIDIKAGANLWLYCWVLAKDSTAYLALPARGNENLARITAARSLRFPGDDFRTHQLQLQNASEDLFGCFGSEQPLPRELHDSWMSLTGDRAPIVVMREEILGLLETMRLQPGIVEAYTPVIVR
jgi:hypothetical protein